MDADEFPANNEISGGKSIDKGLEKITSGDAIRRKKSLGRRFKETFIAGDVKSSVRYMFFDIALPSIKDMVGEALHGGIDTLFSGSYRRRGGSTHPTSGPTGYVQYNRYSGIMGGGGPTMSGPARVMSRMARSRQDFDGIVLASRAEADDVIEKLWDLVNKYESATVADLYDLVGIASSHTDYKWGWKDLRGSGVTRDRDGYLLDLPNPVAL